MPRENILVLLFILTANFCLEIPFYLQSVLTVVSLERGPLSLVSTTEELLDRKVAAPV
jgi:hypothetical protein